MCDSKTPQIARTLLSIQVDISNAAVLMVSTCRLICKSSSPFSYLLKIVPSAPITIGITVTFKFHSFFSSLVRSRYLSIFSSSWIWTLLAFSKFTLQQVFFLFLLTVTRSGRLVEIKWSVCISILLRNLCVSFSSTDSWLCTQYLFICSNINFLHNSQWIILPTQWCLVLYSFCANLLHSLLIRSIISPLLLLSYLPTPPLEQDMTRSILSGV